MVRIITERIITGNIRYIEGSCLSTDSKPTANICTGSLMLEADTGDVYAFAEGDSPAWNQIAALGGGS